MIPCQLRTVIETLTEPLFWRSLVKPPLVVVSGHTWPYPPVWGAPAPSPDEDWQGLVQFDESRCTSCGYVEDPPGWRVYWGPFV